MTFVETLDAAKDTRDAEEYVTRVKSAVSAELEALDSSVIITDTSYFNHSAIPDLVLEWPREKASRAVFLRHSYQSVVDADDVSHLGRDEPVFMSIDTREDECHETNTRNGESQASERNLVEAVGSRRILLTDPSAMEVIGVESPASSPVADLVRANFIRGGRGLIDASRANTLVGSSIPTDSGGSREELISQSFSEDAAARITRTAQLIELALGTEILMPESDSPLVGGKLSIAELRHLVPWLLKQEQAVANSRFWRHLGEYVTFAELESIRGDLANLDVSPLIAANADRWGAKRAYVGLSVPIVGDDTYTKKSDYWSFRNGNSLGIDIGEQRFSVAHNGQLLKPRASSSSATWGQLESVLREYRLSKIDLRGITRSVILTAERSPDIRSDIEQVAENLDDSYTVSDLTVKAHAADEDGTVDVQVDFDTALVTSNDGASIQDLARIALQVLNYRAPVSSEVLATVLPD